METFRSKAHRYLDARGLRCPMPAVKSALALEEMSGGEILQLLSDDPVSKRDIPAWCQSTGNEVVKQEEEDSVIRFTIRKKSP
jgi:tRNA 2-thiouridine synthesizing protein A